MGVDVLSFEKSWFIAHVAYVLSCDSADKADVLSMIEVMVQKHLLLTQVLVRTKDATSQSLSLGLSNKSTGHGVCSIRHLSSKWNIGSGSLGNMWLVKLRHFKLKILC